MRINVGAAIARNPWRKALYFLSLVEGPAVHWQVITATAFLRLDGR
jgi:hypothetical protein